MVPKFPNNRATKAHLEGQSLTDLFIHYMSWRTRFVAQRPRTVSIRASAENDKRWPTLKPGIDLLLDKIRHGDDVTPHLSLKALQEGYTPAAQRSAADRWADKDFLLNVMGFHHFHLGTTLEPKGFIKRTDNVLFAYITRTHFDVLGLFDHSVFNNDDPTSMTAEHTRLWQLHEEVIFADVDPGFVVVANPITTSGHMLHIVELAQRAARIIKQIDPRLDDRAYLQNHIYGKHLPVPTKLKLRWDFSDLDLCLIDDVTHTGFIMQRGPE